MSPSDDSPGRGPPSPGRGPAAVRGTWGRRGATVTQQDAHTHGHRHGDPEGPAAERWVYSAYVPDHDHDHDHEPLGPLEENPIWQQDHVTLHSVGMDIGSSAT